MQIMTITQVLSTTQVEGGRIERVLWNTGKKSWRAHVDVTGRYSIERTRVEAQRYITCCTQHAH